MASRPRRPHTYTIEPTPTPAPTPAPNWTTMLGNNVPLLAVLGAMATFFIWYGSSNTKQDNVQEVVKKLETKIEQVATTNAVATKEQNDLRAALGEKLVKSSQDVGTKIGELSTAIAVQQATQKTTSDALIAISNELRQLNTHGTSGRGR